AHAVDMATNGCYGFNSCDGTLWTVRIGSYYFEGQVFAENNAAFYPDPLQIMNQWLTEAVNPPPADHTTDGHRAIIMASQPTETGIGYAFTAAGNYHHLWTEDFGVRAGVPNCGPLKSGAHVFHSGAVELLANYYDAQN